MKSIIILSAIIIFVPELLWAQDSTFLFKGQADAYSGINFSDPTQVQAGVRFIPSLSLGTKQDHKLKFDSEVAFNTYADYNYSTEKDHADAKIDPYRLWIRLSSARFEIRAGLQKINFGSASMLRPLMWFDRMDPRDPLQLTNGVYGLLGRYYFQNNANAWLWMLIGNDKTKGWETVPSNGRIPEFGGRLQLPVPRGETAISFHHRTAELNGSMNYPEDRLGLDGKWDLGVGLWAEYSIVHSTLDSQYFNPWVKMITLGSDYTFAYGNGLNVTGEFFRYSNSGKPFDAGNNRNLSLISANYPFANIYRVSGILYYDWTGKNWYRIINLQRQGDNWTFYLFLFWNPEKMQLYGMETSTNMFAGKGAELMVVYNF